MKELLYNPVTQIFAGLILAAFITFIIFFYRAVRAAGLAPFKKFTVTMLGVCMGILGLALVTGIDFRGILPAGLSYFPSYTLWGKLVIACLAVVYILAFIFVRREQRPKLLVAVWAVIWIWNFPGIIMGLFSFITWKPPVGPPPIGYTQTLLFGLVPASRATYLAGMIQPLFWVAVSMIGLRKIYEEKGEGDQG